MKVTKVCCQGCGADLQIDEGLRYVTFPLFGLLFIGFAIFSMINGTAKAETYQQQQTDYETRRQSLLPRLERERE